jgi:hypothetical protein
MYEMGFTNGNRTVLQHHGILCREKVPKDRLDTYRGVVISSEVAMFEAADGRVSTDTQGIPLPNHDRASKQR